MPVISVLDHVYFVCEQDSSAAPLYVPDSGNGLVVVQGGMAVVATGTDTGPVLVDVQRLGQEPDLHGGEWEEIVDVSLQATETLVLCGHGFAPYDLPPLTNTPGTY